MAGQYAGNFRPEESGAYEVSYQLSFPDGEKLEQSGFVRVGESGLESKDTTFAERDLQMLAKITGESTCIFLILIIALGTQVCGEFTNLEKEKNLADAWPIFIALFWQPGSNGSCVDRWACDEKNFLLFLFWVMDKTHIWPSTIGSRLCSILESPETNATDSTNQFHSRRRGLRSWKPSKRRRSI